MIDFFVHFLVCNLLISGMIGILFGIKNVLKSHLTSRICPIRTRHLTLS